MECRPGRNELQENVGQVMLQIRSHNPLARIIYNPEKESSNPMQFSLLLALFVGGEIVDLISTTGPVAKFVLLTLLAFSLISWAIILTKWSLLSRARLQSGRFLRAFRKAQRLQDIATVADQFRPSPLVGVFEGGFQEYKRQLASPSPPPSRPSSDFSGQSGASLTPSTGSAPPALQLCAPSPQAFPKLSSRLQPASPPPFLP